jgi:NAD(P)-dependent dehydrogenase (short-subunit alcohol dehydrogenase family)
VAASPSSPLRSLVSAQANAGVDRTAARPGSVSWQLSVARSRPVSPAATSGSAAAAKLANVLFGTELDRRLRHAGSPVRSFIAHPGMASTPMHDSAQSLLQRVFLSIATPLIARTAEHGTLPLLFAATSPAARTGVFLGPSLRKSDTTVHFAPVVLPGDGLATAARLWSVSQQLTGVRYLDESQLTGDRTAQL